MNRTRANSITTILIFLLAFVPIIGSAVLSDSARIQSLGAIRLPQTITVDSYGPENYDTTSVIEVSHPSTVWNADSAESQSFVGAASKIFAAGFYLRRIGAPSGQFHAVIYSHRGGFGNDSMPNIELARSDAVEASAIPTKYTIITFAFSGAEQIVVDTNVPYCLVLEGPRDGALDSANNIQIGMDSSSPTHGGSWARYRYNTWRSMANADLVFYVYGVDIITANISGRVVHSDGTTPFGGASITLSGYSAHTTTGSDGTFNLSSIPGRLYTLRAQAIGYQTVERIVNASAGGDTPVSDISLLEAPRVRVYGFVTYVNLTPANGITVNLIGDTNYTDTTDASGLYDFPIVIEGNYELEINVMGYRQLGTRGITVSMETRKDITLAPRGPSGKVPIPPDGQCYHAAFASWGDTAAPLPDAARQDIDRFVSIVGKSLYAAENGGTIDVGEDFWPMREPNSWKPLLDEGVFEVFIFSLNPYLRAYPSDSDTINGPTATEWKIANGDYDAWINTLAQEAKAFNYTIMLKIGAEMNGNQGPNGPGSWIADFGADPEAFIAAWRRIVDIFSVAGVTNVDWCASYNFESVGLYDFEDYYAGSDYVDWIGVDYYQVNISDSPSSEVAAFYSWAVPKNKPLAVTEWGTNWYNKDMPDADRARYINDFFDDIASRPEFKMVRYHWNSWWRFQDDDPSGYGYMPLTAAAYRDKIADNRYLAYVPLT